MAVDVIWGCSGCWGLIWKNAMARSSMPIHMMMSPGKTKSISRNAPMKSSKPAVEKSPTADFVESSLSERLTKYMATMANTMRTISTAMTARTNEAKAA